MAQLVKHLLYNPRVLGWIPQDPRKDGRTEPIPPSCPVTPTGTQCKHANTNTHTFTRKTEILGKVIIAEKKMLQLSNLAIV